MSEFTEEEILLTYKARCDCDKHDMGVGYLGNLSIETHRSQMLDPKSLVHIFGPGWIKDFKRRNLIASAPAMYELLERLRDYLDQGSHIKPHSKAQKDIIEALALAEKGQ